MALSYPCYHNNYPFLESLIRNGGKALISLKRGSNLRSITVTKRKKVIAYGQFPYLAGALIDTDQDAKEKHPDSTPQDQYSNKNRHHFHHHSSGVKPRKWDVHDRLIYDLGMYYLMDLEIYFRRKRFWIKPIIRQDVPPTKKRFTIRIGKGGSIMDAFYNLETKQILPQKRRRRKTLADIHQLDLFEK